MDEAEALRFLERHQPLPSDEYLEQHIIDSFDEARSFFAEFPNPASVSLLLNSFGDGDGLGVYPLVENTVLLQAPEIVMEELVVALQSHHHSVRYWCAQIAANYPHELLVTPLVSLLTEQDYDIKYAALTALEQISSERSLAAVEQFSKFETDPSLVELAKDILDS